MPNETLTPEQNTEPSLEAVLNDWDQNILRLESEVEALAGTHSLPDWFYENGGQRGQAIEGFKEGDFDPSLIGRYYDVYSREQKAKGLIYERETVESNMGQVIFDLGVETVVAGMQSEPETGVLHEALLEYFQDEEAQNYGDWSVELEVLRQTYQLATKTELLGVSGGEYAEKLRPLMRTYPAIRWMRYNEEERKDDDRYKEQAHDWMVKAVQAVSEIGTDEAAEYTFSASKTTEYEAEVVQAVLEKFDHFGIDRLRSITSLTGIRGLEAYSVPQLERMERLVDHPEKMAEELEGHDVIAVMVNRVGDHNGILTDVAANFDDDKDRVLFFEIDRLSDIYRRAITLKKLGIRPSTLVLAAHSAEGQFMVSDDRDPSVRKRDIAAIAGRKLVSWANTSREGLEEGMKGYAMHGMKGVARLVKDVMQPSRGIDDSKADLGREKIIFQACEAGTVANQADLNEAQEKVQVGEESVISQLAKDLSGFDVENVDIYGAPTGIQLHRTDKGVRYSAQPDGFSMERTEQHAIKVSLNRGGELSQADVDEVVLRK